MIAKRFVPAYEGRNGWYGGQSHWIGGAMEEARYRARAPEMTERSGERRSRSLRRGSSRGPSEKRAASERRGKENNTPNADKDTAKKNKTIKWLGLALALTSSASISLGISNTAVTATTVLTSDTQSGCFQQSQWFQQLGPRDVAMRSLDWSWVTVGLWSALLSYLAGMVVGKITKDSSSLRKFLMFAGIASLVAFLPVRFIFAILDSLLSSGCQETNTAKFALPVSVAVFAVIEFVLLLVILLRLRKQVKEWREAEVSVNKVFARRYNANRNTSQQANNQPAVYNLPQLAPPLFQPTVLRPVYGVGVARRWAPQPQAFYVPTVYRP